MAAFIRTEDSWATLVPAVLLVGVLHALFIPAGCFVKLPQTPEQAFPTTLPDGKPLADLTLDEWRLPEVNSYPDWRWWVPDTPETSQGGDYHPAEVSQADGSDAGGLVFEWVCLSDEAVDGEYPELLPEDFAGAVATNSFLRSNQVLGNLNRITVYSVLCGKNDTYYVPERAYAFRVDEPIAASIQLNCDAPCYAFLTHSGCEYEHFENCWNNDDAEVVAQAELLPGLYLVGVEFPGEEEEPRDAVHIFDLHLAMNRTTGQESCPTESATSTSTMAPPECALGETHGWATAQVSGALEWSDDDDFFLDCSLADVPADKLGGMPDEAHRFEYDPDGAQPGLLKLTVSFEPSVAEEAHIIALTGDPCGAADAVIDCVWGVGQELSLEGISVFPGERLYAIVDGVGSNALNGGPEATYELTWSLLSACP